MGSDGMGWDGMDLLSGNHFVSSARGSQDSSTPDERVTLLAGVPTKDVMVLTRTFFILVFREKRTYQPPSKVSGQNLSICTMRSKPHSRPNPTRWRPGSNSLLLWPIAVSAVIDASPRRAGLRPRWMPWYK